MQNFEKEPLNIEGLVSEIQIILSEESTHGRAMFALGVALAKLQEADRKISALQSEKMAANDP